MLPESQTSSLDLAPDMTVPLWEWNLDARLLELVEDSEVKAAFDLSARHITDIDPDKERKFDRDVAVFNKADDRNA